MIEKLLSLEILKNLWNANMEHGFLFFKKKDREVKFKTNCFYKDTLPKDFICKDDISARKPVVFGCP